VTEAFSGTATVETYTVTTNAARARVGIVVGRLDDGTRTLAVTRPNDDSAIDCLMSELPLGVPFTVTADGKQNSAGGFRP
jgi:acetyl-CoA C-acetyltransferase